MLELSEVTAPTAGPDAPTEVQQTLREFEKVATQHRWTLAGKVSIADTHPSGLRELPAANQFVGPSSPGPALAPDS